MKELDPEDLLPNPIEELEMDLKQILELSEVMLRQHYLDLGFMGVIRNSSKRGLRAIDSMKQ